MYDVELVKEILHQVLKSAQTIIKRFEPINSPEDFLVSDTGLEKLDAICMQLIAIGESVKHLDKVTKSGLLSQYSQVEWKRIMGMRDVLSHHYFDLDAELVYEVCDKHIKELQRIVHQMRDDLAKR